MGSRFKFLFYPVLLYKRNYFKILDKAENKVIMHPQMQDNYVDIAEIPTRILTLGKWVEEPFKSDEKEIVICITGNPGLPGFYINFITTLFNCLNNKLPIWIIGHAGHDEPHDSRSKKIPRLQGNEQKYDLNGQLKHKIEFLQSYVPPHVKIHLIGHSVGAWTILQLLKDPEIRKKIHNAYLLFPTIERMKDSPAGVIFTEKHKKALWYTKIFYVLTWLPYAIRKWVLNYYIQKWNLPDAYLDSAMKFANARVLERIMHMGKDQVDNVYDLDVKVLKENKDIIKLYYGQTDHWCPKEYFYDLKKNLPEIDAELDQLGMAHAFNVRKGPEMAKLCAQWIKLNRVIELVERDDDENENDEVQLN